MRKNYRFVIVILSILVLAACSPAATATPGGAENGAAAPTVPVSGSQGTTVPGAAAGGDSNLCVGVDTAALMSAGEAVYTDQCAGCHGEQGEGQGDFPALTNNTVVTGEDVVGLVQAYFAVEAHPRQVTAEDLAAVLTFARGSFGNTGTPVCADDIQIPVQ